MVWTVLPKVLHLNFVASAICRRRFGEEETVENFSISWDFP